VLSVSDHAAAAAAAGPVVLLTERKRFLRNKATLPLFFSFYFDMKQ